MPGLFRQWLIESLRQRLEDLNRHLAEQAPILPSTWPTLEEAEQQLARLRRHHRDRYLL